MSSFAIIPTYKTAETSYQAPTMIVEAGSYDAAIEIANNSALGRFPEWTFRINPFNNKKIYKGGIFKDKTNPNSKSQKGKKITGFSDSRPVRRALLRLKTKQNNQSGSHHKGGSMKMW